MLVTSLRHHRRRRGQFSLGGLKAGCCCVTGPTCGGCDATPRLGTVSWTSSGNPSCCTTVTPADGSGTFTIFQDFPCEAPVNVCGSDPYQFPWNAGLLCVSGVPTLFITTDCPTNSNGCAMSPDSTSCSPLLLTYTATGILCLTCFVSFTVSA